MSDDLITITREALLARAAELMREGLVHEGSWYAEMSEPTSMAILPVRLPVDLAIRLGLAGNCPGGN